MINDERQQQTTTEDGTIDDGAPGEGIKHFEYSEINIWEPQAGTRNVDRNHHSPIRQGRLDYRSKPG